MPTGITGWLKALSAALSSGAGASDRRRTAGDHQFLKGALLPEDIQDNQEFGRFSAISSKGCKKHHIC
jgi:hypothetical protein